MPTKSDSDIMLCIQSLSKTLTCQYEVSVTLGWQDSKRFIKTDHSTSAVYITDRMVLLGCSPSCLISDSAWKYKHIMLHKIYFIFLS